MKSTGAARHGGGYGKKMLGRRYAETMGWPKKQTMLTVGITATEE